MLLTGKEPVGGKKPSLNSGRELLFFRRLLEIIFAVNIVVLRSIYARANDLGYDCLEQLKTQQLISIEMSKNQLWTDATVVAL